MKEAKFVKYKGTFYGITPNKSYHVRMYQIDEWGRNIPLGWLSVRDMPEELVDCIIKSRPWAAAKLKEARGGKYD